MVSPSLQTFLERSSSRHCPTRTLLCFNHNSSLWSSRFVRLPAGSGHGRLSL